MPWLWIILGSIATLLVVSLLVFHIHILVNYLWIVSRIFQEKPLFILPFGQPVPEAEEIVLETPDGLKLQGCYWRTLGPRKGVIFFGLEFGSNRWACVPYCEFLRNAGYDIFTCEMRGQGKSPAQEGYEPLQWVTEFELIDFRAALDYLKNRPDRDPRGIGLFGLSKGGSAGLMIAAADDFVRCFVVDGIFAALGTMVPYMRQWVMIYTSLPWMARLLPSWYLIYLGKKALRQIEQARRCRYPSLERCMGRLTPRPLLMIHGGGDTYIKPDMACKLFDLAREPKEFWLVDKAKHNQAFHLAQDEYKKRVLEFFDKHLAAHPTQDLNGTPRRDAASTTAPKTPDAMRSLLFTLK